MADTPEDDELLLDQKAPEEGQQAAEGQDDGEQGSDKPGELGEEELEVFFGDEAAPASGEGETGLVKHLREQIRERDKRLAEAEKHRPQQIEVGEEPTLEGCNYDEVEFKGEWRKWNAKVAQAEAEKVDAGQAQRQATEQWQRDLQSYDAKKAQLRFADVEEVEAVALDALNLVQQGVVVKAAENPALVMYSLGKHPGKLAELSKITDPLKMAAAVARLEGGLKVGPKRKAPDPEEIASGTAGVTHGTDKQLERLEKEAEKSGDVSKLAAYKASLNRKAA